MDVTLCIVCPEDSLSPICIYIYFTPAVAPFYTLELASQDMRNDWLSLAKALRDHDAGSRR